MACAIEWTENARDDLQQIVAYLKENWSLKVAENFIKQVNKTIDLLSVFPLMGMKSNKDTRVRQIVITKQNLLFYTFDSHTITILDFFDTRANPESSIY